jgi:DNA (cytosine-5)-methyltransferase 1
VSLAYYNEFDEYPAQWLRNLSYAGHIAAGKVDARSIREVSAADLLGATQAHFFAGIGVWSRALRLAGIPDDFPIWSGSCPCQPFSVAGRGAGFDDERHLWPVWFKLIEQCRPAVVVGEQVEGKDGRAWLDLVSSDLEGIGYAFGAAVLPSAGVGAPHIRSRTYFVAHDSTRALDKPPGFRWTRVRPQSAHGESRQAGESAARCVADSDGAGFRDGADRTGCCVTGSDRRPGPVNGFWGAADWISCTDGKWRPVEPGTFPLVDGAPSRVGRLCAYGNAINAYQAATFLGAAFDAIFDS